MLNEEMNSKIKSSQINTPFAFSFLLTGLLILLTILHRNYEFLLYAVTTSVLVFMLFRTNKNFNYKKFSIWLFNIWLVLHILGGLASYDGVRVYDVILLNLVGDPYFILKFDQFVHFYCYITTAILMWSVVKNITESGANSFIVCVVTILAATGIGALNEIIEFTAVVTLGADGVGGYINTAIDLTANLLGAITGTVFMYYKS